MTSAQGSTFGVPTTPSNKLVVPPQQQSQQWRAPAQEMALPLHVQSLEKALDVGGFLGQLEKLLTTSLETASSVIFADHGISDAGVGQTNKQDKKSLLTTKGIWEDEQTRKRDLSSMYNFSTLGKRKWLKNLLLEDSDSDSETEQVITERDVKILLKIHKYRRKYQKRYHTDILNSQYTYFGAGLLSEHDRFPEHQKFILDEYGFSMPPPPSVSVPSVISTSVPVSLPKKAPPKRRRNIPGTPNTSNTQSKPTSSSGFSVSSAMSETHLTSVPLTSPSLSVSSPINQPMTSVSLYPYFAVPFAKSPCSSMVSTVLVENKVTAAAMTSVPALARPIPEPSGGDLSADASRWRTWNSIATEDIPKAYTERIIQRKYRSVVLKQMAVYCAQFLEQAREAALSGKYKPTGRHGKKHGQIICLRPISKQGTGTPGTGMK